MTFKDDYSLRKVINVINGIIIEAVEHGGDSGGPYFSNEKDLVKCLRSFIDDICDENQELIEQFPLVIIYDISGHIPQIAILVK